MKKYNPKLDLKSNLYKEGSRSPRASTNRSKSPLMRETNSKKNNESEGLRNKTFQNICCPNCRYLFRAPKEEIIFISNTNDYQSPSKKQKNRDDELYQQPYFYGE